MVCCAMCEYVYYHVSFGGGGGGGGVLACKE